MADPSPAPVSAPQPIRWNVLAECQMIVVPQKNALKLIPALNDSTKIEAAYLELQELIDKGEANLEATLAVKTLDGVQGISKSVKEVRHPTEFDPHELPTNVPKENQLEVLKAWPLVGVMPTQFDTSDVGATLECTATIMGEGQWLSVAANPKHVRLERWQRFEAGMLPTGVTVGMEQPVFLRSENKASTIVRNGQLSLLGVHKMPQPPASLELFLLRVTAKKVE